MKRLIAGFILLLGIAGSFDASVEAGIRYEYPVVILLIALGLIATGAVSEWRKENVSNRK